MCRSESHRQSATSLWCYILLNKLLKYWGSRNSHIGSSSSSSVQQDYARYRCLLFRSLLIRYFLCAERHHYHGLGWWWMGCSSVHEPLPKSRWCFWRAQSSRPWPWTRLFSIVDGRGHKSVLTAPSSLAFLKPFRLYEEETSFNCCLVWVNPVGCIHYGLILIHNCRITNMQPHRQFLTNFYLWYFLLMAE